MRYYLANPPKDFNPENYVSPYALPAPTGKEAAAVEPPTQDNGNAASAGGDQP